MMLHQDGSRHDWLQGQPPLDLIVTMDDATSQVLSAFLVEEEGTASSLRGLAETFGAHGLPLSLYTDRGSHYFYTPEAGGKVLLTGTLYQEGVPEHWVMVLPLALEFSGGRTARAVLPARGPATPVQLRLPEAPQKVELDPGKWILSLKTSEKRIK